jgi:hypothetical protein
MGGTNKETTWAARPLLTLPSHLGAGPPPRCSTLSVASRQLSHVLGFTPPARSLTGTCTRLTCGRRNPPLLLLERPRVLSLAQPWPCMLSPSGSQHCVVEGPWRLKPVEGFIQLPSVSPVCFAASLPDSQDFAAVHVVCTSHCKTPDLQISHVVGMQEPVPWTN